MKRAWIRILAVGLTVILALSIATPVLACGTEGCTPGFWKNHLDVWYIHEPGDTVASFFASAAAYPDIGSATMLEALSFHGGPGAEGAARILIRAAVAAALNAAHPSIDYSSPMSHVRDDVNAALDTGDRSTMLSLATQLDTWNNQGCAFCE